MNTYNVDLPGDMYYNILMDSDPSAIENICMINKTSYQICSNPAFWINKFNQDGLPFLYLNKPTTAEEWIGEYNYLHHLRKQIDQLFNLLALEKRAQFIVKICTDDEKRIIQNIITFLIPPSDNCYRLLFKLTPNRQNVVIDDFSAPPRDMSITRVKSLLLKILYYLPNNAIVDTENVLLFKTTLMRTTSTANVKKRLALYNNFF